MSEEILREICTVLHDIHSATKTRPNLDSVALISSVAPYILDYRDRYYVYIWGATSLTLTLEDLGQISVSQYTWTNISFTTGMHILASGQATPVSVFIRCTDNRYP